MDENTPNLAAVLSGEHDPAKLVFALVLEGVGIEDDHEFVGRRIAELQIWLDRVLRLEDAEVGQAILRIANRAVYYQAAKIGWLDAIQLGESRLSASARPLWVSGYKDGFSIGIAKREPSL